MLSYLDKLQREFAERVERAIFCVDSKKYDNERDFFIEILISLSRMPVCDFQYIKCKCLNCDNESRSEHNKENEFKK